MSPLLPPQRLRPIPCLLAPCLIGLSLLPTLATAAPTELPTVDVVGQAALPASSFVAPDNEPTTTYRVGRDGIDLFGGAGGSNPYALISRLPSVNANTVDPYGLGNLQGGNKGLRVRGEQPQHGSSNLTFNGLPLTGTNPGPGAQWLFDSENIDSLSVSQGPIAPNQVAFFTTAGVVDNQLRGPQENAGVRLAQSIGSYDFRRSYARGDSGKLADGSLLFVSASLTSADKWRGPGEAPSSRENFAFGYEKAFTDRLKARFFLAYNDTDGYTYRGLTYAQASNLGANYKLDYLPTSSATAATAVNYYGYNKQQFTDWALLGEVEYRFGNHSRLLVKPFYVKETGSYYGANGTSVQQWLVDHDWYGLTAEVQTSVRDTGVKLGYWWNSQDLPGPPSAQKLYATTAGGALGAFSSWSTLAKASHRHEFNSLYAVADHHFDRLRLEVGARYLEERVPTIDYYRTTGIGDLSYDQALAASSVLKTAAGPTLRTWLPFAALSLPLTASTELKASIGRNYGAPSFDVANTFKAATYSQQQMQYAWGGLKPETADSIDLGLRQTYSRGYLEPKLFYSKSHNKGVTVFDPTVSVSYAQNIAESHAYGLQLAGAWVPVNNVEVFGNLSWNRSVFDQDLRTAAATTVKVSGLQLPDTPRWLANLGGSWRFAPDWQVASLVHYTGSRYGDTLHAEAVSGYTTVDVNLAYQKRFASGRLNASLTAANLFDKQYIGLISSSYWTNSGAATYYPGAPRSLVAKVGYDF